MARSFWRDYRKIFFVLGALFICGVIFFTGARYGYEHRPAVEKVLGVLNQEPPPQFRETDMSIFWDVWSRVEEKYVDKEHINRDKLVLGAISGLVKALDDPYTEFLPPQETKQFQEDIKGSFGGVGAEIAIRKGVLTIVAPLKGSPADHAGLKALDKIIKIEDTSTADLALDKAVQMIRGPTGTPVKLTVFRDSFEKPKEFRIIRDIIHVQILETERKPNGIFVIQLHHFTENAANEFRGAVQEFYQSGSQKLILDLRNNPGGFLQVAVDIASWFVPAGDTVAEERMSDGQSEIYRSHGYRLLERVPVVVLVNQGSASAAEIVAGALRDARASKLIGAKTFGKGSVQEVINLPKNSSLKLTIAKWLTPHGTEINGKGLEPDILVELPAEPKEGEEDRDLMMEKAVEVLQGMEK